MANFLDNLKIKTAIEDRVKLDLGCDHITTANFMQFNVAYTKEMVPKEKISINMETFTRLNPMPVPTFGRAKINNRAFFVPFRTIFDGWNEFITDTPAPGVNGPKILNSVPIVRNSTLVSILLEGSLYSEAEPIDSGEEPSFRPDYVITQEDGNPIAIKLNAKGRQFIKLIESLGYKVIPNLPHEQEYSPVYSALPLMAMAKVYIDWFFPSAYIGDSRYTRVQNLFDNPITELGESEVFDLIAIILDVCYDSDYFVSAWDNPVAPNSGAYSQFTMNDPTHGGLPAVGTENSYNGNGTPTINTGITSTVSQWAIDALKSLTDYMKRHQLVGARALDRYLARFGVNLAAEKLKRSVYIGSDYSNIQFGDIMSTADTEGAALGNYAGKGIGYGTSNFDFSTDEYGILIIVSTIVPKTGYYQGINRNVMHVFKTDYWTPEFDNLGTQAISAAELYCPMTKTDFYDNSVNYVNDRVFGWTPRYAEYKVGRDMLTGDFRYNSINEGIEAWHTLREVEYDNDTDVVHNLNFVVGSDADQYSRIFYNTDADAADKFNVIHHFEIASWSPMKSLFDTYEFDSKGATVTEDVNGVKMN